MVQAKNIFKKIIFTIILCSIIVSFCAIPSSYAKLELKDGEFYYAGTTKGSYVPQQGIFDWIVNLLGEIADWLLGIITMAFRMVFVGYTALIEHLLTNVLESASGVKVNGDDVSATDMSTLTDSSNNITVQGIVYNMVAALDVNFFVIDNSTPYLKEITKKEVTIDTDGKKKEELVTKTYAVSPTGLALKCKKCGKPVRECCTGIKALEGKPDSTIPDNPCTDCECGGNCDACREYAALVTAKDPIIVQLKNLIAIWYYIIRFLASAAMLIVLIGIGIKLAISNISSEKALYKRVLTDWVVGVIMIFAIHYIMIFAININEILIDTIRASANSINSVELKQLSEKSDKPILKSDDELEIDLYEEIRSRAYDAKLTVGLSGMILYMALVYLTFKYTLVYLKRFLTLAVLTLMGPAVGVSYALQKTLSGKAHSFKSWLSEYILNLIIQPVHAIIYAVFVSAALSITLENVAGIIIAIILMNFSLKAEMIFRRIFNLDPGGQGLLGATENAGDINQLNEKRRAIIGGATGLIVGGKPAAKLVTAIPRAVVGAGLNKAVATVLPKAAQRHKNKSNSSNNNNSSDSYEEGNSSSYSSEETSKREQLDSAARNSTGSAYQKQKESATSKKSEKSSNTQNNTQAEVEGQQSVSDQGSIISDAQKDGAKKVTKLNENAEEQRVENGAKASTEMEKEVEDPLKKSNNTADKIQEKNDAREKSQEDIFDSAIRNISTLDVIRGHKNELLNVDNYFDIGIDENGNEKYTLKEGLLFGTKYKDPLTGKTIRDTSNMAYKQLTPEKLLGFTDKDKQFFKEKFGNHLKQDYLECQKCFLEQ